MEGTGRIEHLLDGVRRRLVDTGARNRLVHVNRDAKRANTLNIINERSDSIFDILRINGKKMQFAATLKSSDEDSREEILLATNGNGEAPGIQCGND
jgi:hypothetical protein